MTSIAVALVSLPERLPMLKEALDSVHAQIRQPDDVVVGIDPRRLGEAANVNRLVLATDCDFVAFKHDDDTWQTNHLQVAEQYMNDYDVIVSRFDLEGRPVASMEPWHDNFEDLRATNWISSPSCIVIRRELCGEWTGPTSRYRWIDWANYNRWLDEGLRFVDTKEKTVICRFHGGNGSWQG